MALRSAIRGDIFADCGIGADSKEVNNYQAGEAQLADGGFVSGPLGGQSHHFRIQSFEGHDLSQTGQLFEIRVSDNWYYNLQRSKVRLWFLGDGPL